MFGCPTGKDFLWKIDRVLECKFPLDALARVSLLKPVECLEYCLLIQVPAGNVYIKMQSSEGKIEERPLKQWVSEASG